MNPRVALLAALSVLTAVYAVYWFADARRRAKKGDRARPTLFEIAVGAVTNFFDTLGIGSFAPTTSVFKLRRIVPDEKIPGTINIGHAIPVVVQAFIFIAAVGVEIPTLFATIAAAILGAWLGAGVVSGLPRAAHPDRHGHRAARGGGVLRDDEPGSLPGGRRGARSPRRALLGRPSP